jgi:hypothetical protein
VQQRQEKINQKTNGPFATANNCIVSQSYKPTKSRDSFFAMEKISLINVPPICLHTIKLCTVKTHKVKMKIYLKKKHKGSLIMFSSIVFLMFFSGFNGESI